MHVTFDRRSLIIGGRRRFILSGAFHYFRHPHPDMWKPRLELFKAAGLNAVDVYIPWHFHEEQEGVFDFEGVRDVERVFRILEELGLYLIARAGPYCCAELHGGGFPGWLLRKEVVLRCKHKGTFQYDENYVACVERWYRAILPRIAACPNLILFQIENEYQFLPFTRPPLLHAVSLIRRLDPQLLLKALNQPQLKRLLLRASKKLPVEDRNSHNPYMQRLYALAREHLEVPIFHNDVASFGERQLDVDIPAIDDYSVTAFEGDPWKNRDVFASLDLMEEGLEATGKKAPLFVAEFQGGWFDMWDGVGYPTIRRVLGVRQLDIATKTLLSQGATLINYYMFCGGTSWGYMGSPDVYTSYDFAAPIGEAGLPTRRWEAVRRLSEFIWAHEDLLCQAKREHVEERRGVRTVVRTHGGRKLFYLRNMSRRSSTLRAGGRLTTLPPVSMKVLICEGGKWQQLGPIGVTPMAKRAPKIPPPGLGLRGVSLELPSLEEGSWSGLEPGAPSDMVSLGFPYGFVWYRTEVEGGGVLKVDARHLASLWASGCLLRSWVNFQNRLAVGEDVPVVERIRLPFSRRRELLLLVESLGQNKDFEEDARQPRGLVFSRWNGKELAWRWRGGLVAGEKGMTPTVNFSQFGKGKKLTLPFFPRADGLYLYRGSFRKPPKLHPLRLKLQGSGRVNIYLNGVLLGRFGELGPQSAFYLPTELLQEVNELCLVQWLRRRADGLRSARLVWEMLAPSKCAEGRTRTGTRTTPH